MFSDAIVTRDMEPPIWARRKATFDKALSNTPADTLSKVIPLVLEVAANEKTLAAPAVAELFAVLNAAAAKVSDLRVRAAKRADLWRLILDPVAPSELV